MAVPPQGAGGGVSALSELVIDIAKNWSGYAIKNLGQPSAVKDALRQPGDDEKIYFGADSDYSIRYDSTDDCYYVRDEANGVDIMKLVKNAAGAPIDLASHASRHKGGGDDPIRNVTSQSADYTASDGDVVLADASGGAITITLPSPSANAWVEVKKTDSSTNAVTVDGGGNNIDGAASFDITTQYESYTMVSDGSSWFIV